MKYARAGVCINKRERVCVGMYVWIRLVLGVDGMSGDVQATRTRNEITQKS
jgi:hypothetical protein